MSETRTKMCFEELLDKFDLAAKQWLKETPEARGLMLVVDWSVGKDDFPPCVVVSKELTEQSTIAMMRQSTRLMEHLTNIFAQLVNKADSVLAEAEVMIRQNKEATQT